MTANRRSPHRRPAIRRRRHTPIMGALIIGAFLASWAWNQNITTETITVCSVGTATTSSGNISHQYRVYAAEGVFVIEDSWINGMRLNSADDYGRMARETAKGPVTYVVTAKGHRVPAFSMFPNVLEFRKAPVQTPRKCEATS